MPIVNLGILAHVDAGKTSLTERILFETGVIDAVGRVDRGDTQTDTLAIERERGITIQSAVVSFQIGDLKVNLIDTPGHSDFIAEVERALSVLDAVVLVVSAVEGVQAQTRHLVRAVQTLGLPLIVFVNKIDRGGAREAELLVDIRRNLGLNVVAVNRVIDIGRSASDVALLDPNDEAHSNRLLDALAEHNDDLIASYLQSAGNLSWQELHEELNDQARLGRIAPVFFGSAMHGRGADQLIDGFARFLPSPTPSDDAPLCGVVFKIQRDRDRDGEKICHVRMFSGRIAVRQRVVVGRRRDDGSVGEHESRITGIDIFDKGGVTRSGCAGPGEIARVHGLKDVRIGDWFGRDRTGNRPRHFSLPALESFVRMEDEACAPQLHNALRQLAEQDPLISIRIDSRRGEISVRLYGEVQKEFIAATLLNDFGLDARFEPSRIIFIERLVGIGSAVEYIGTAENPFAATIGFRVEPNCSEQGLTYRRELGSLPLSFYKAIEDTVDETLQEGLAGWQVTGCTVTLTHTGYASPVTVASDFRKLTPLVLIRALEEAGTRVHEPVHRFVLQIPAGTLGEILAALGNARAIPGQTEQDGDLCTISGTIPLAEIHAFEQRLPGLGRGEGMFSDRFDTYQELTGPIVVRPRTDRNPLNRKEYLSRVSQGEPG
jgi:ribosomal protection tetracycline resistance protein